MSVETDALHAKQAREEQVAVELARLGWVTPVWIRANEAVELLGNGHPEDVDARFVEYYERDGAAHYKRLVMELSQCLAARPWAALVAQMDSAYCRGDYAIIVPAAFVVLEGVLARGRRSDVNLRTIVQARIPAPPEGYSMSRVMLLATSELIAQLYGRSDFDRDEAPALNRHRILHGRAASDWSQADSLRLMQACYVAAYLVTNPG